MQPFEADMLYLVIVCALALQVSAAAGTKDSYKAAVVEFSIDQTSNNRMMKNFEGIKNIVEKIKNDHEDVDIVVLPEDAITGYNFKTRADIVPFLEQIPTPNQNEPIKPCNNDCYKNSPFLQALSCLADENSIVIVANMGEKDDKHQYNVNVVFEKNGDFIAKYRKQHLYGEEKKFFDPGTASCDTFTTSFGVKFGTFSCFDILYNNPGKCLLEKGIKNFAFPSAWGNSFPLYMSVAFQQGWSLKHGVNLLAANQHDPSARKSGTGSGIYSAGYAVQYGISGSSWSPSEGHYYVHEILKNPSENPILPQTGHFSDIDKITASSGKYARFIMLNEQNGAASVSTFHPSVGTLTCELRFSKTVVNPSEYYALGAYIGKRDDEFGYSFCTVVQCSADDTATCGYLDRHSAQTEFTTFKLSGSFPDDSTVYATVLGDKLQLLNPSEMEVGPKSLIIRSETLMNCNKKILSATLWTRNPIKYKNIDCIQAPESY